MPIFKKTDVILASVLIIVGLGLSYFLTIGTDLGAELKVTCNGKVFGTYSLLENRTINVEKNGHYNRIVISNGEVSISDADCQGQDCVHQHAISLTGETIVCLPNKLILEITGGEKAYDSISK